MKTLLILLYSATFSLAFIACSGAQKPPPTTKTTTDLRTTVTDFHKHMRWGMWEQASAYVAAEYKPAFDARYDELGDDFKISSLEVKNVINTSPTVAVVDVEQESYKEPEMTVKKIRYMESWVMTTDNVWRLTERIEKDEWEKRKKEKEEAEAAAVEAEERAEEAEAADEPPQPSEVGE